MPQTIIDKVNAKAIKERDTNKNPPPEYTFHRRNKSIITSFAEDDSHLLAPSPTNEGAEFTPASDAPPPILSDGDDSETPNSDSEVQDTNDDDTDGGTDADSDNDQQTESNDTQEDSQDDDDEKVTAPTKTETILMITNLIQMTALKKLSKR